MIDSFIQNFFELYISVLVFFQCNRLVFLKFTKVGFSQDGLLTVILNYLLILLSLLFKIPIIGHLINLDAKGQLIF